MVRDWRPEKCPAQPLNEKTEHLASPSINRSSVPGTSISPDPSTAALRAITTLSASPDLTDSNAPSTERSHTVCHSRINYRVRYRVSIVYGRKLGFRPVGRWQPIFGHPTPVGSPRIAHPGHDHHPVGKSSPILETPAPQHQTGTHRVPGARPGNIRPLNHRSLNQVPVPLPHSPKPVPPPMP